MPVGPSKVSQRRFRVKMSYGYVSLPFGLDVPRTLARRRCSEIRQLSSLLGSMLERLTLRDHRCAAGVPWQVKRLSPYCRAREFATLTWTPHPHSCGEVPTSSTRTSNMRDLVCLEWSCLGSRRIKPNLFTDRRGSLHQHCARLLKASHRTTFNCFFGIGRGMLAMIGRHVLESLASTVLILR